MTDKFNSHVDPAPDFERFIDVIRRRVACEKHPSEYGDDPCYVLPKDSQRNGRFVNFGVCNWRARQAGFIGVKSAPRPRTNSPFVRS